MATGRSRRVPTLLIGVGVVAIAVGAMGLAFGWGSTSASTRASTTTTAATTTVPNEKPAAFLAAYVRALRSGDTNFVLDRLDPAVLARYGAQACRDAIPGLFDPTLTLTLRSVSGPSNYQYASDGKSVTVPNVYTLDVDGVIAGSPSTRQYHVALVDGRFHLFIDCGTPLPGAP